MGIASKILRMRPLAALVACAFTALAAAPCVAADAPAIPHFWDSKEQLTKPDIESLPRLRFLTTIDFPPFNFLDRQGRLTGFNVDLARAVCAVLEMADRCQIQALPWDELGDALESGDGEAIIAGLSITAQSRAKYAFSRSYLRFPARFVAQKTTTILSPLYRGITGKRIGVVEGSAHEKMLRRYFPDAEAVTFPERAGLFAALRKGKIDALFGDGMRLSFWLGGSDSKDCCGFVGGPYLAPEFFGAGLAIAAPVDTPELAAAFDYALREINVNGTFAELYLRYFPVSFF